MIPYYASRDRQPTRLSQVCEQPVSSKATKVVDLPTTDNHHYPVMHSDFIYFQSIHGNIKSCKAKHLSITAYAVHQ
jgi:hypothetical protein